MTGFIPTEKFTIDEADGTHTLNLLVDGMHCPSCVAHIENALNKQEGIINARLNLSTKRLRVSWKKGKELGNKWVEIINNMGYRAVPFDPNTSDTFEKQEEKFLLRCLAIAGFASGNLMLFSIPMWTATGIEMGALTRSMFQWIQVLIAVPAIIYSGIPFYKSAFIALKDKHTNMDVPISVAVILTTFMSIFEIVHRGQHAYLDSSVMLLFFLLIGRYLDTIARGKARSAAHDLLQMMTGFATVLHDNGSTETIPLAEIKEGMVLIVSSGEKVGADGEVIKGESEIDTSLITGESIPQKIEVGAKVFAGTINISAPIQVKITKAGENSLLADIIKLMEKAEQSQAKYVTIADKISGWYTPVVHILAGGTFLFWWLVMGMGWQASLLIATTVLIITCPCALGLAVPVVQVLASSKLMRSGILIKSGDALERLADITHIAFDKTGTLTIGKPQIVDFSSYKDDDLQLAASIAAHSKHPLSAAISAAYNGELLDMEVTETPGYGLEAKYNNKTVRLGKRSWCGIDNNKYDNALEIWLAIEGAKPLRFKFVDQIRKDAGNTIQALQENGYNILLVSGDREEVAKSVAAELGIQEVYAGISPLEKCEILEKLKNEGSRVLMVGDGLNDAPSLASAAVSMSPSSAMDITQNTADIVFQGERLKPILTSINTAKFTQTLVKQNFILAIIYNIIAIPLAVMGFITPLIAAIAMSASSLTVVANALRLNIKKI